LEKAEDIVGTVCEPFHVVILIWSAFFNLELNCIEKEGVKRDASSVDLHVA